MDEFKYAITEESIAAMIQYCNVTPQVMQDIITTIKNLMDTYDSVESKLVPAHRQAYRDVLYTCRDMLRVIADDVNASSIRIRTLAHDYAEVIESYTRQGNTTGCLIWGGDPRPGWYCRCIRQHSRWREALAGGQERPPDPPAANRWPLERSGRQQPLDPRSRRLLLCRRKAPHDRCAADAEVSLHPHRLQPG